MTHRPIASTSGLLVGLLLTGATGAMAATVVDITECGQIVPARAVGVLQNDLDCELVPAQKVCWYEDLQPCTVDDDRLETHYCLSEKVGVYLGLGLTGRATLQMNGHSIHMGGGPDAGVECRVRHCKIEGPGEISGGASGILTTSSRNTAKVSGLDVHDCNVGIDAYSKAVLQDVVAHDNTESGIVGLKLRAKNVTVDDNGSFGIYAQKLRGKGVHANGNGIAGVHAEKIGIRDSTFSSNGLAATGADLRSVYRPRIRGVTCSRSEVCEGVSYTNCTPTGETWGVCAP